ncbi:hypothetical protein [Microbacterium sp. NPDC089188]|uniref:hypothetical protein n=1 Tax=Microbacterium sp. NPDC089188 TaxID=3154971 RepID=UPI00341B0AB3
MIDWDVLGRYAEIATTFLSTISGQILSWPVAVLLLGVIFYRPISELIGRIESGEAPGVKFKVRAAIHKAEVAAIESTIEGQIEAAETGEEPSLLPDVQSPPSETGADVSSDAEEGLDETSSSDVRESKLVERLEAAGRVLNAYAALLSEVDSLWALVGSQSISFGNSWKYRVRRLAATGHLNQSFVVSFDELTSVRASVAHGAKVSPQDARDFERTAKRLQWIVRKKKKSLSGGRPAAASPSGREDPAQTTSAAE